MRTLSYEDMALVSGGQDRDDWVVLGHHTPTGDPFLDRGLAIQNFAQNNGPAIEYRAGQALTNSGSVVQAGVDATLNYNTGNAEVSLGQKVAKAVGGAAIGGLISGGANALGSWMMGNSNYRPANAGKKLQP